MRWEGYAAFGVCSGWDGWCEGDLDGWDVDDGKMGMYCTVLCCTASKLKLDMYLNHDEQHGLKCKAITVHSPSHLK